MDYLHRYVPHFPQTFITTVYISDFFPLVLEIKSK